MKNIKFGILMLFLGVLASSSCDKTIEAPKKLDNYAFPPRFTAMYLVGGAVVGTGWNIGDPADMTPDPNDPFIFTWQGEMIVDDFKIPTHTINQGTEPLADWGCDYFMPKVNGESDLDNATVMFVEKGSPDNKWHISVAGTYKIVLDTREVPGPKITFTLIEVAP